VAGSSCLLGLPYDVYRRILHCNAAPLSIRVYGHAATGASEATTVFPSWTSRRRIPSPALDLRRSWQETLAGYNAPGPGRIQTRGRFSEPFDRLLAGSVDPVFGSLDREVLLMPRPRGHGPGSRCVLVPAGCVILRARARRESLAGIGGLNVRPHYTPQPIPAQLAYWSKNRENPRREQRLSGTALRGRKIQHTQ